MGNWRFGIPECRRKLNLWRSRIIRRDDHDLPPQVERQRNRSDFMKILNFPTMCEILPFYGYLDEWWLLMTNLWSNSYRVWSRNLKAFEFRGREFIRYSWIWDLESLKIYKDISLLFWRQSNYIKRLVFINWSNKNHSYWIINVIRKLKNDMILSIVNDINTDGFCYHVWAMQSMKLKNQNYPIIINPKKKASLYNHLLRKLDSDALLSKIKWLGGNVPFIAKKINPNKAVMYSVQVLQINLIWNKLEYLKKNSYSLNIENFYENQEVSKSEVNSSFKKKSFKQNKRFDCIKYRTVHICSWFTDEFIILKEKFKWFTNIRYIIMHSHDFNSDIKSSYSCFHKYRNIFVVPDEYEKSLKQEKSSNPFLHKYALHAKFKAYALWAASIDMDNEIVGLCFNDKNAWILKQFSSSLFMTTFVVKLHIKEWILVKIEDLYWQVELGFKNKKEYKPILVNFPELANCIEYYPNDYLFLVNLKSIAKIIPYSLRAILDFNLVNWKSMILKFDESFLGLDLNKIKSFWKALNEDCYIEVFTSKVAFEKIWRSANLWKAIQSNPVDKISINKICSLEASENGIIVTLNSTKHCYNLTRFMYIINIIDQNGLELRDKSKEKHFYDTETFKWLWRVRFNNLLFRNK